MAQGPPQPGCFHQQLQADVPLENVVLGGRDIPDDRVRDVRPDVERRRARRPVAGALLPVNRPPWERRTGQAEQAGPLPGHRQGGVAPPQGVGRGVRCGVDEYRQYVAFRIPEGVAVVAGTGQALRRDRPALGPRARLQDVEQGEADGLLHLRVTIDFDVGPRPEVVEVRPLFGEHPRPAGLACRGQRGGGLVAQGRQGPLLRPAVRDELDQPQFASRRQHGGHGHPTGIIITFSGHTHPGATLDDMVHGYGDPDAAVPRPVHQPDLRAAAAVPFRQQGRFQNGRRPWVRTLRRQLFVGDQLRLHHHPRRGLQRLDLVTDRRHRPLDERHQAHRRNPDRLARR